MNGFQTTWRWAAFPASVPGNIGALIEAYGAMATDKGETFKTLLCGWDDAEQTQMRGMALGSTAPMLGLTDGRYGTGGLWSEAIVAAWQANEIEAEELTEEEFKALMPTGT
jgi:hypothetical protein